MRKLRSWFRQFGPEAPRKEPVDLPASAYTRTQPPARRRSLNESAHKRSR